MKRDLRGGEANQALHVYHLRINQVKMKVKFQCKMKIDYNNESITLEVPHTGSNLYSFNHDITLCEESTLENCFTLSVSLVTSKGAKYIAALAYLYHNELLKAASTNPGSKIDIPLSKCLDPEGSIEILVKQVTNTGNRHIKSQNVSATKQRRRVNTQMNLQLNEKSYQGPEVHKLPQISPRGRSNSGLHIGSKSEVNLTPSIYNIRTQRHHKEKSKSKHRLHLESRQKRQGLVSSRASLGMLNNLTRIHAQEGEEELMNRSHAIRENSYSKLKQRLKKEEKNTFKEHQRRVSLQNSQNYAKLQALKFKLKCQEFQKDSINKNSDIRNLQDKIASLELLLSTNNTNHQRYPQMYHSGSEQGQHSGHQRRQNKGFQLREHQGQLPHQRLAYQHEGLQKQQLGHQQQGHQKLAHQKLVYQQQGHQQLAHTHQQQGHQKLVHQQLGHKKQHQQYQQGYQQQQQGQQQLASFNMIETPRQNVQNQALISLLQSKVAKANEELEELRIKVLKLSKSHNQKQVNLNRELEQKKTIIRALENQISSLNAASVTWKNNSHQNHQLNSSIQIKNKMIVDLQGDLKQYNSKVSELQKSKRVLELNNSQLLNKIQNLTRNQTGYESQKMKIVENVETYKNKNNMAEFTITSLKKTIQKLEADLSTAMKFRQKFNDCQVELKRQEGERKLDQKNYQNSLKLISNNLMALQQKYNDDIDSLNKKIQDFQSKALSSGMKIKQLQSNTVPSLKNQLEQFRRNYQRVQRENEENKSSDRAAKRQLQTCQAKINQITGQMEMYKNKLRSLESIHKIQTQKFISESKRLKEVYEQQVMKQLASNEKNQSVATQYGIVSSKLNHLQQKYHKETKDLTERLEKQSKRNKELEESLKKQGQSNIQLVEKQKRLMNKLQQYGENEGEYSDLIRRYQKELAKWQNQLKNTEDKLAQKTEQLKKLDLIYKQVSIKFDETYHKLQDNLYENKNFASDMAKLQKDYDQIQYYLAQSKSALENKDKNIQRMKTSLQQESKTKTNLKEELIKVQMNYDNLSKDYERFREHLYGVLMREFAGLDGLDSLGMTGSRINAIKDSPSNNLIEYNSMIIKDDGGHSSPRNRQNYSSQKNNPYLMTSSSTVVFLNTQIIATINQFSKQSKNIISKLIEDFREMEKQIDNLKQDNTKQLQMHKEEIKKHNNAIHSLEDELTQTFNQKKLTQSQFLKRIVGLEKQIQKLAENIEKKQTETEEILFTLNGVKMEKDSEKQYFDGCLKEHENVIQKLEQSLEHLHVKYVKLQSVCQKSKAELNQANNELNKTKTSLTQFQKKHKQQVSEILMVNKVLDDAKVKNKSLLTQVAELEMHLTNQKEKNNKTVELMSQQQKKLMDTKDFMNNLIKQKQAIVKQDIANNEKIIQLEGINSDFKFTIEDLNSKIQGINQQISQEKDNNRKLTLKLKNNEQDYNILQESLNKLQLKHKQKQNDLIEVTDKLKAISLQLKKEKQKNNRETLSFREEIDINTRINNQEIDNFKKQISKLEDEIIVDLKEELRSTKSALEISNRELEMYNKQIQEKDFELHSYRELQDRSNENRLRLEKDVEKLMDELRTKDEQLYELSGELYSLEQRYHQKILSNQRQLQKFEEDFGYKYEGMVEDYQTKLDEMEKERDYLKHKLIGTEEQLVKVNKHVATLESEVNQDRLISQERLIKTEEQKNYILKNLKNELTKMSESKQKFQEEGKKLKIEMESLKTHGKSDKNMIQKYEHKIKESQQRIESLQSQLQSEVHKQKKKDMASKKLEDSITNYQWGLEREIKKELQNLTKSIVVNLTSDSDVRRRIMDGIKDIETRIIRVVADRAEVSMSHQ